MNWTIKYGEKPMSKKPNRQIKVQFFRSKSYPEEVFKWAVRIDIADHTKGYTFLDQSNHSNKFPSLKKAKEYADGVVKEVIDFLDIE